MQEIVHSQDKLDCLIFSFFSLCRSGLGLGATSPPTCRGAGEGVMDVVSRPDDYMSVRAAYTVTILKRPARGGWDVRHAGGQIRCNEREREACRVGLYL